MGPESNEKHGWRQHRLLLAVVITVLVVLMGLFLKNTLTRFMNMAVHAKSAEGMAFLNEIHQAQLKHFEQHGEYVAVGATPQQAPGKRQIPFESEHMEGWKRLGWQPESMVRCQYEVTVPTPKTFRAVARCDADGDGEMAVFVSSAEHPPKRTSPDNRY